jgi:hypothetical protein
MFSFPARPPELSRVSFDHRGLSVFGPLAPLGVSYHPVLVHRPAVLLPASSPRSVPFRSCRSLSLGWSLPGGTFTTKMTFMLGAPKDKGRTSLGPPFRLMPAGGSLPAG